MGLFTRIKSSIKSQKAGDGTGSDHDSKFGSAPPPYKKGAAAAQSKIKAKSIPQIRWSNKECRQWLTEVLVEYGNMDRDDATQQASAFEGFGPALLSLAATGSKAWRSSRVWGGKLPPPAFAWERHGQSLQCLIRVNLYAKGALPKDMEFRSLEQKESKPSPNSKDQAGKINDIKK